MNRAADNSTANIPTPIEESDLFGALVIDATGKVIAANSSAREIFTDDKTIVGRSISSLCGFKTDSSGCETEEAAWQEMRAAALDRWVLTTLRPLNGSPCPARVRLERAFGGAGSYVATIRPGVRA